MSDLYDKIVNERGSLESLMAKIPGFRGYLEHAARHQADTLLREHIASQIAERVQQFVRTEKIILDKGGLSYMGKTRDVKGKIQLYHDKVATAAPGYSGMWAQIKIGPEEMEAIYAFDEAQFRYIDQIEQSINAVKESAMSGESVDDALYALDEVVTEAIDAFALRDDVILNLGQSN